MMLRTVFFIVFKEYLCIEITIILYRYTILQKYNVSSFQCFRCVNFKEEEPFLRTVFTQGNDIFLFTFCCCIM